MHPLASALQRSNQALHRTAICVWDFALGFFLFISQFVAVGELGRSACDFMGRIIRSIVAAQIGNVKISKPPVIPHAERLRDIVIAHLWCHRPVDHSAVVDDMRSADGFLAGVPSDRASLFSLHFSFYPRRRTKRCTEPPIALGDLPWSFRVFICQFVAVGELGRSAASRGDSARRF